MLTILHGFREGRAAHISPANLHVVLVNLAVYKIPTLARNLRHRNILSASTHLKRGLNGYRPLEVHRSRLHFLPRAYPFAIHSRTQNEKGKLMK